MDKSDPIRRKVQNQEFHNTTAEKDEVFNG